jgi:hypothetical protein
MMGWIIHPRRTGGTSTKEAGTEATVSTTRSCIPCTNVQKTLRILKLRAEGDFEVGYRQAWVMVF